MAKSKKHRVSFIFDKGESEFGIDEFMNVTIRDAEEVGQIISDTKVEEIKKGVKKTDIERIKKQASIMREALKHTTIEEPGFRKILENGLRIIREELEKE